MKITSSTHADCLDFAWVQSLGQEDPLEKGKATHSSILAWRIPQTVQSWDCKELDMTERLLLSDDLTKYTNFNNAKQTNNAI